MRSSLLLVAYALVVSGCAQTGAFHPPVVLPPGRAALDLVGAHGDVQHTTRGGGGNSAFTLAEGRLAVGFVKGAEAALHASTTGAGGSVRVMPFGPKVPVAIFAGGGRTRAQPGSYFGGSVVGTSRFAGVSAGLPLPPSAALVPYVGLRYVGMDVASEACGDGDYDDCSTARYPPHQYAISLGVVATRSGPTLELSLYNGPPVAIAGGVLLRLRL